MICRSYVGRYESPIESPPMSSPLAPRIGVSCRENDAGRADCRSLSELNAKVPSRLLACVSEYASRRKSLVTRMRCLLFSLNHDS